MQQQPVVLVLKGGQLLRHLGHKRLRAQGVQWCGQQWCITIHPHMQQRMRPAALATCVVS
jgi:hypothetical protein